MENNHIYVFINARVGPFERSYYFEDPVNDKLSELSMGEVMGSGTFLNQETGEVASCDLGIMLDKMSESSITELQDILNEHNIPKGSYMKITATDKKIPVGKLEGLVVYFNGTELADEVYEECSINVVAKEFNKLIKGVGEVFDGWDGPMDSALYLYGRSANEMKRLIKNFTESYPLCEKCKIEQIA